MAAFKDDYTKETEESWHDAKVRQWKQRAKDLIKSYYIPFQGSLYDENDESGLKIKILYALFGPPDRKDLTGEENIEELYTDKDQLKTADSLLSKIKKIYKAKCPSVFRGEMPCYCM